MLRKAGIAALSLVLLAVAVIEFTSIRNRARLNAMKEEFCAMELPPGAERRQCLGIIGTIAPSAAPGKHCDYLVWMKVNSDVEPDAMLAWMEDRAVTGTDGETTFAPEVFESKAGIAPSGVRFRYHVQVIDAGHEAGLDPQCHFGP